MAQVTRRGFLDMQVCVPVNMTDDEVIAFAEQEYPAGTKAGWQIRRQADYTIPNQLERAPCDLWPGHVHITLDA